MAGALAREQTGAPRGGAWQAAAAFWTNQALVGTGGRPAAPWASCGPAGKDATVYSSERAPHAMDLANVDSQTHFLRSNERVELEIDRWQGCK
jgi:hypothetical protein